MLNKYKQTDINGFTLLEILIAIFILAVVLSTIFAIFIDTFKNINYTESQGDVYQMAWVALERIQEDLECSFLLKIDENYQNENNDIKNRNFSGKNEMINDRDADMLSFFSTKQLSIGNEVKKSGLSKISFYVIKNDENKMLVLYRSDIPELEDSSNEKTGGVILCENLDSVNFIYYNFKGDEFENWDSSKEEFKGKLPAMVVIRLEFLIKSVSENPLIFETGILLPTAENYIEWE